MLQPDLNTRNLITLKLYYELTKNTYCFIRHNEINSTLRLKATKPNTQLFLT